MASAGEQHFVRNLKNLLTAEPGGELGFLLRVRAASPSRGKFPQKLTEGWPASVTWDLEMRLSLLAPASAPSAICKSLLPELTLFKSLLNILSSLERLNNKVASLSQELELGTDIWVTFEHKLKGGFVSFRKAVWRSLSGPLEPGCRSDYLACASGDAVRRGREVPAIPVAFSGVSSRLQPRCGQREDFPWVQVCALFRHIEEEGRRRPIPYPNPVLIAEERKKPKNMGLLDIKKTI